MNNIEPEATHCLCFELLQGGVVFWYCLLIWGVITASHFWTCSSISRSDSRCLETGIQEEELVLRRLLGGVEGGRAKGRINDESGHSFLFLLGLRDYNINLALVILSDEKQLKRKTATLFYGGIDSQFTSWLQNSPLSPNTVTLEPGRLR